MKLKQEFVLRSIAGENVLIPVTGLDNKFDGLISLNESGVVIWKALESGCDEDAIVNALLEEYEVTEEKARQDVQNLLNQLRVLGILG